MNILFSVILPVYNQQDQVEYLVRTYTKELSSLKQSYELIFVVNGTWDHSYSKLKKAAGNDSRISVYNLTEEGWGRAVRFGISKAAGEYFCYTNSARTDSNEFIKMLNLVADHKDSVIKAKRMHRENFVRTFLSYVFNLEARLLFGLSVRDINATPKIIPRNIYKKLSLHRDDDLLDAEILIQCINKSIPVVEFPIFSWKRISGTSTTTLQSALKMYLGLISLKMK